MNNKDRSIEEIKNDIKIVSSNKLSVSQSKMLFIGFVYEIILNKNIFPKNSNLKKFINDELKEYLNRDIGFKDYLFASRTLLAARIQKELYYSLDYKKMIELAELIDNKLLISEEKKYNNKNIKNSEKAIEEWRNYFKNKGK
ncbi:MULTISPECIES: hypothetical protein [Clostridium]|uniref:hypothetical protein n=1 Tax=Clostridium TaxID=1485 RepID=UPI0006663F85|nr:MULTISPECIES: hypothetical protein [Clostridium]KEI87528.1 hypothetical protein N492_11185 [Clostridium botulinum B2 267]